MENTKISFNDIEFSPLRSLDDFLMESARFQMPNVKDLENLIHPMKMLCGTIAIAVAFGLFYYLTNAKPSAIAFKKDHPIIGLVLILGGGYFIVFMLSSVLVFLYGILLPIVVIFTHASLRLRNIKNKVTNKLDSITARKTPMGLFLQSLGLDQDIL
ncbi:hypothetical protein B566_EDAN009831 [Ephemera danica]|nr:hypothetical protein B566_EDAN009831 [Ephemera danica]